MKSTGATLDFGIIDYDENYLDEITSICGPFARDLAHIFPSKSAAYVILTRKSRRRVWFAFLAATKRHDGKHDDLRHKLLFHSAKELLEDAFGDLPAGFLGLIKTPSVDDLGPTGFMVLHRLLSTKKLDARHLHGHTLEDDLLSLLDRLPDQVCSIKVAKMFPTRRHFEKFETRIAFLEAVTGTDLRTKAYEGLLAGCKPDTVVYQCLSHVGLPEPVLPPCSAIKHIKSAAELMKTAKMFENCLQQKLPDALSGSYQYYIYDGDTSPVVFSIRQIGAKIWIVDDIQKKDEFHTSLEDLPDLASYLENNDIHGQRGETYRAMKSIMNMS